MRSIELSRMFHPVGQGAFYTERFRCQDNDNEYINIVYDCGSTTGKKHVLTQKQIGQTFKKKENIDAVFISHLHEDHINGIPDLIERCNVKKIFFPIISDDTKILLKIRMIIDGASKFTRQFIDEPIKAIKELEGGDKIELIAVLEDEDPNRTNSGEEVFWREYDDEDRNPTDSGEEVFGPGIEGVCHRTCNSGRDVSAGINPELDFWTYIPYNFEQISRLQELKTHLKNVGFTEAKLIEIGKNPEKYQQKEIPKLREAYKKLPGGLNSNSMTLYSGIKVPAEYLMAGKFKSESYKFDCVFNEFMSALQKRILTEAKKNKDRSFGDYLRVEIDSISRDMNYLMYEIDCLMKKVSCCGVWNLMPFFLQDCISFDCISYDYTDAENDKISTKKKKYKLIGCLYTGDYDANAKDKQKVTELKRKYKRFWPYLGVIQVPHHGSGYNYNTKLIKRGLACVISAGTKNRYKHPSKRVISDISNKGDCYIVTEKGGGLRFDISIRFCR